MLAMGFLPATLRRLALVEGGSIALIGAAIGCIAGVAYSGMVIYALNSLWQGAVHTSALQLTISLPALAVGYVSAVLAAVIAIWIVVRRQTLTRIQQLQAQRSLLVAASPAKISISAGLALIAIGSAVAIVVCLPPGTGREATAAFFAAGALMLIGTLAAINLLWLDLVRPSRFSQPSRLRLALSNCARKNKQSLAVIGLLACGIFLVVAVAANQHNPQGSALSRSSGTGGFLLYGEASLPILQELDATSGRQNLALDPNALAGVKLTYLRVHAGDDASCLNLNRVRRPRLVAVAPQRFAGRFTVVAATPAVDRQNPWSILDHKSGGNVVPGIADYNMIVWGLGKSLGDCIDYVDERGDQFQVKLVAGLAGSILPGSILIGEPAFLERFPGNSGARIVLIEAPASRSGQLQRLLSRALEDVGLAIESTRKRLARFSEVENTYLSIFLALGGLGVLIGSSGVAIVILRNASERRSELALLRAIGFSRDSLQWLLLYEYSLLLGGGLLCGTTAALVAVFPAITSPATVIPYCWILILLAAILGNGVLWAWLSGRLALRGDLIAALRTE